MVNPCRNSQHTFEKLKSNAIGDQYIDAGQYYLRRNDKASARPKSSSGATIFKPSGSNKTVRKSEFQHLHNGPQQRQQPNSKRGFLTRSTFELF